MFVTANNVNDEFHLGQIGVNIARSFPLILHPSCPCLKRWPAGAAAGVGELRGSSVNCEHLARPLSIGSPDPSGGP